MSNHSYISCIKISGVPIIPPLVTPKIREECLEYKRKAVERERRKERNRLFQKCMEDLERLETQTKDLTVQSSLEHQLTFKESQNVPYQTYKKLKNLTSETIDVSEYSNNGVKVLNGAEDPKTPPKLIRSNSYTLESPSPILLAHLEKEARKCVEFEDDSGSISPVTIIDSEPTQLVQTDVSIEKVTVKTPLDAKIDGLDPQLLEILSKLPQEHAVNILDILSKQQETQKEIEDKSIVSISSQSLYYSTLSPDISIQSPDLQLINLRNSKMSNLDKDKAASLIQAHVRGYLIRRLLRTEKVQNLIKTIKEAVLCAIQLHSSEIIEEADIELHRRLIQQVSAACYAFHDIFFVLSTKEKMGIISTDRQRKVDRANRPLSAASSTITLSSRRSSARMIR